MASDKSRKRVAKKYGQMAHQNTEPRRPAETYQTLPQVGRSAEAFS